MWNNGYEETRKKKKTKPTHMKFLSSLLTASLGERIGKENVFYCKVKIK